jgi:hypothetical protein
MFLYSFFTGSGYRNQFVRFTCSCKLTCSLCSKGCNAEGFQASWPPATGSRFRRASCHRQASEQHCTVISVISMTLGTASGDPTEANWVGESFLKSDNKELLIGGLKGNLGYVVGTTLLNLLSYSLHVVIWRLQHFLRRCVKFVPFFNQESFPRTSISSTQILPSVGRTSIFVSPYHQHRYPVSPLPEGHSSLWRALELAELMVTALLRRLLPPMK